MSELNQILMWAQSGEGRLIAAAALFLVMWAVKNIPVVADLIDTPRRKQAATIFMGLTPAVWLMVAGEPWVRVVSEALVTTLAANGLNTYRPSKVKP